MDVKSFKGQAPGFRKECSINFGMARKKKVFATFNPSPTFQDFLHRYFHFRDKLGRLISPNIPNLV
jgi:hypothetical protein